MCNNIRFDCEKHYFNKLNIAKYSTLNNFNIILCIKLIFATLKSV